VGSDAGLELRLAPWLAVRGTIEGSLALAVNAWDGYLVLSVSGWVGPLVRF
jgi:hypothetical protein